MKELAELAFINKATFYSHYDDIYDLSEQLENETIDQILMNISNPEEMLTNPKKAVEVLLIASSQDNMIRILFSGDRISVLTNRFEKNIKNKIYELKPEYKDNLERNTILTYLIQGGFHVFMSQSKDVSQKELIEIVGNVCERLLV